MVYSELVTNIVGPPIVGRMRQDGYLEVLFPELGLVVAVHVDKVADRPEIVGLQVRSQRGPTQTVLRADLLRQLPLRQLRQMYLRSQAPGGDFFAGWEEPVRQGPRPVVPLTQAAATWLDANRRGLPVIPTMMDTLGLSRPGVTKYIRRAREAGLIPPRTSNGRPTRPPTPSASDETIRKAKPKVATTKTTPKQGGNK